MTVCAGGSSSVFKNACGAGPVIRSASSTMKTFHGASAGRSAASRSSSRMSSMRRASGPFGFFSGGVGAISRTSGQVPRSMRAALAGIARRHQRLGEGKRCGLSPGSRRPDERVRMGDPAPRETARLSTSTASS